MRTARRKYRRLDREWKAKVEKAQARGIDAYVMAELKNLARELGEALTALRIAEAQAIGAEVKEEESPF